MRRLLLLQLAAAGCTLQFDPKLIAQHDCVDGCWDGAQCQAGTEANACGTAGAACQACGDPTTECVAGACVLPRRVVALSAGVSVTAVLDSTNTLWTFGQSSTVRTLCHADGPPALVGSEGQFSSLAESCCNVDTTLAIAADGAMWGCGYNLDGQIGDGTTTPRDSIAVANTFGWKVLTAGGRQSMGIRANGTLWGWGFNGSNRLGYVGADTLVPVQVGSASNWTAVSTHNTASCGLDATTVLSCWGNGPIGRTSTALIAPVEPTASGWAHVSVGGSHACAIRIDGTLWCWGSNSSGQVGIPGANNYTLPQQVDASTWTSVWAGHAHTCATRSDGTLWCWGDNVYGELGTGDTTPAPSPVQVGTDTDWDTSATGWTHTCASKKDGTLWCWGEIIGVANTPTPLQIPLVP